MHHKACRGGLWFFEQGEAGVECLRRTSVVVRWSNVRGELFEHRAVGSCGDCGEQVDS